MPVVDPSLPAIAHLTGPGARDILDAALASFGGVLESTRPCHMHYRPGSDIVVRFDSRVRWGGLEPVAETLVAAVSAEPLADTLRVEAVTPDGDELAVGVWRWPFDPLLPGLGHAVTPSAAARFLDGLAVGRLRLTVVAYRPTQRAVVRAVDEQGTVFYLKVVRPAETATVVERHDVMREAGVSVPVILHHDATSGLMAMAAMGGRTIRERIKRGHRHLPAPAEYEAVYEALARVELAGARPVASRSVTGRHHANMLAAVLPAERGRTEHLRRLLKPAAKRSIERSGATIHGDLYEGQLITGRGPGRTNTIAGVLDLDDAGPGDPLDDRATVIAHLLDRTIDNRSTTARHIARYAQSLRSAFAQHVDPVELDLATAGALLGLATGPFRLQHDLWPRATRSRLSLAVRLAARPGQRTLLSGSVP